MSAKWNRYRLMLGDLLSLIVVAFVARNACQYAWYAYQQGWTTSSTWAPALWIPYFFMAFGLIATGLQMLMQIIETIATPASDKKQQEQNLMGA